MVSPLRGALARRLAPLLLVLLLAGPAFALPPADAPPLVPTPSPDPPPVVGEVHRRAKDAYAGLTGERLDREDVEVRMEMEFHDLDVDPLGVALGGGRVAAQARLTTRIDFHVVSVARLQEAVEEATGFPANSSAWGLDASRQFMTADAFRATLAGEALAAFQQEQERRVVRLLTDSFPDVTVRASRFEWSNASLGTSGRPDPSGGRPTYDPRDPPVTLVSVLDVEYQKRRSLVGILEDALAPDEPPAARAGAPRAGPSPGADPFALLGVTQAFHLRVPPGWDLTLRLRLPEGLTLEDASPDVRVDADLRGATTGAHAGDSDVEVASAVALTIGSRHAVALGLLAAVLVVGAALRVPAVLVANRLVRRR